MAFSHMPVFGHGAVRLPRHCRLPNISLFSAEQMRVTNCTFVDNVAGVTVTGTASFRNVTISRTRAFAGGKYCCGADANFALSREMPAALAVRLPPPIVPHPASGLRTVISAALLLAAGVSDATDLRLMDASAPV